MKRFNSWLMWLGLAAIASIAQYRHVRLTDAYKAHIGSLDAIYQAKYKEHVRNDSLEIARVNKRLENAGLYHKGIRINNHHKQTF